MTGTAQPQGAAQPPAVQQAAPPMTLKHLLDRQESAIQAILPKHMTADRLIKTALVAVNKVPALLDCTPMSVLKATMEAAELGLDFTGNLGQAYLVPFNCKVQVNGQPDRWEMQATFMPGYRGLITLARRSGEIRAIEARLVYAGDEFTLEYGLEPKMVHNPCLDAAKRGKPVHVYAIARFKEEGVDPQCEVMTHGEVEHIRSKSKAKNASAWTNDWGEMARKTVVKRLSKYLPLSPELAKAIEIDNERFGYEDSPGITITQVSPPTAPGARSEALVAKLKGAAPSEPEPDGADLPDATPTTTASVPETPSEEGLAEEPPDAGAPAEINADLQWILDSMESTGKNWKTVRGEIGERWPNDLAVRASVKTYSNDGDLSTIRALMGG